LEWDSVAMAWEGEEVKFLSEHPTLSSRKVEVGEKMVEIAKIPEGEKGHS